MLLLSKARARWVVLVTPRLSTVWTAPVVAAMPTAVAAPPVIFPAFVQALELQPASHAAARSPDAVYGCAQAIGCPVYSLELSLAGDDADVRREVAAVSLELNLSRKHRARGNRCVRQSSRRPTSLFAELSMLCVRQFAGTGSQCLSTMQLKARNNPCLVLGVSHS